MTVSALAETLSIDRSNVSRLCDRMVRSGHLERVVHATDARARPVCLTAEGTRLADAVDAASAAHFEQVVEALGDDAETVLAGLSRLAVALKGLNPIVYPKE